MIPLATRSEVERENEAERRRLYRPPGRPRRWIVNREDWRLDAACAAVPVGDRDRIFFPTTGSAQSRAVTLYDEARRYCQSCPVVGDCLATAMNEEGASRYRPGFRGNLTPAERTRLGTDL